jgi:hypothetical protein
MTEDEKRILKEEFKKAGSVPALLEAMAREETKEFRDLRDQVEQGPHHPTGDDLYNYALGWLDKKESLLIMDHLVLCGTCLREVIRIRKIEEALTEDALKRADRLPLLDRVKSFISQLSFPVSVYAPALEPVRGVETEPQERCYAPGTKLSISVYAPADGYVVIFHCCEETGEVKPVFPLLPEDNPKVSAVQHWVPVEGCVEGPQGRHFFKIFWTRMPLLDLTDLDLQDLEQSETAKSRFFEGLEGLDAADWQETTYEYSVVESK